MLDNLRKQNAIVLGLYCMCKKSGESISRHLLHCEVVRDLWSFLFKFGKKVRMPRRVRVMSELGKKEGA